MATITPSDTLNLDTTNLPRALYFGGAGNVVLVTGGVAVTVPVAAYQILPVRPDRINSTSTTATPIFGMYD
jgi:hypothetical protein